jgi:hypothetical protein
MSDTALVQYHYFAIEHELMTYAAKRFHNGRVALGHGVLFA